MNYCSIEDLQQFINNRELLTSIQKSNFDLEEKVMYVKGIYVIRDVYTNSVHVSECYINKDFSHSYYNYGEDIKFEITPQILRYSDDLKEIIHSCSKHDLLDINLKCNFDSKESKFNFEIFTINKIIKSYELVELQIKYNKELQIQKEKREEKERREQQERLKVQQEKERREHEEAQRRKRIDNYKSAFFMICFICLILGFLYWLWMDKLMLLIVLGGLMFYFAKK